MILNTPANCSRLGPTHDLKIGRNLGAHKFLHSHGWFEATMLVRAIRSRGETVEGKLTKWTKTTHYYGQRRDYPRTREYQVLWLLPLRDLSHDMIWPWEIFT
jgi:hypothetical protein